MKKLIPILLAILICSACGEDFFETTLKVDPPPHEDQLVLHTFVKSNDSLLYVSLSKSRGILETSSISGTEYVNDASIEIYEDGLLKLAPEQSGDIPFNYKISLGAAFGGVGKTYEIKVTHATLGAISATQIMPAAPVLISAKFDEDGGLGTDTGERVNAIDITFNDPAGENNLYEVIVTKIIENGSGSYVKDLYTYTNDVNASRGLNDYHLLDDTSFDGQEYTFQIETDYNWDASMQVYMRTVTRDWYLYSKSQNDFQESGGFGLFSEPVTVHTNIVNGLGAFGMASESRIAVEEE